MFDGVAVAVGVCGLVFSFGFILFRTFALLHSHSLSFSFQLWRHTNIQSTCTPFERFSRHVRLCLSLIRARYLLLSSLLFGSQFSRSFDFGWLFDIFLFFCSRLSKFISVFLYARASGQHTLEILSCDIGYLKIDLYMYAILFLVSHCFPYWKSQRWWRRQCCRCSRYSVVSFVLSRSFAHWSVVFGRSIPLPISLISIFIWHRNQTWKVC